MNVDIAIIGGGLAGLSTILPIVRSGKMRVALVEGAEVGSNNPSPLTFTAVVRDFDLADCCKENYSSFIFHNCQGSSIEFRFLSNQLVVLDYKKACRKMLNEIENYDSNFTYIKALATGFVQNEGGVLLHLDNGASVRAKLLIDASGKTQFLARFQGKPENSHYSHVYGGTFSNVKNLKDKQCCFLLPSPDFGSGGGWFYSLGPGRASFGYATISEKPIPDYPTLKEKFNRAFHKFEPYAEYLKDAHVEHIESGVIPITPTRELVQGRVVIIGDAGGMATNWTCMGIEPSLEYGRFAGDLSVRAILENYFELLNNLQNRWDAQEKPIYDLTAKHATTFWTSGHYFWEWIIKNDLALLSPEQLLDRLRRNSHILKWFQIIPRAINYKILSLLDKNVNSPRHIVKGN
jgi:flavin-dependent dehydrogenase